MKILTIVGARPQFIKEALLSAEIARHPDLVETLVHTGQHHDANMSDIFFTSLDIPQPDYNLGVSGGTHASMTGRLMQALEGVLEREDPDMVVVFGDTNSTLAGALTATKMHFPVCHAESGVRTRFLTNPEEVNRVCTDHTSVINCAPTPSCLENLLEENLGSSSLFTGDLMFDAFKRYSPIAQEGRYRFLDFGGHKIAIPDTFYYLTCHREENTNKEALREVLYAMEGLDYPVVYPMHPRMRRLADEIREEHSLGNIFFIQPVGYLESLFLLDRAKQVTTDSGGIQREAFFAGKKCVTLLPFPAAEELLEGDRNTLLPAVSQEAILDAMRMPQSIDLSYIPFGRGNAAEEIVKSIKNYLAGKGIS
jgi:UDP-N-acetylglucosamine 2-epimerase (non-hydrolysing)/UDP-GlcNAc3NAcA epimerase